MDSYLILDLERFFIFRERIIDKKLAFGYAALQYIAAQHIIKLRSNILLNFNRRV